MNKTYDDLMKTRIVQYDDSLFTAVSEDKPKTMPLVTSSLGLQGLRSAFEEGSYTMRTTCLDTIMARKE
jgi:hypothetical protein